MAQPDKLAGRARRSRTTTEAELAADLSPDLLLMLDDKDRVTYANVHLTELLGRDNSEILAAGALNNERAILIECTIY